MTSKAPYGTDIPYADPGYQKDGVKRYPINDAGRVRTAWDYINVSSNAAKYTPAQVSSIKARIMQAAKKFGVDINAEKASWLTALIERYASPTFAAARRKGRKHRYIGPTAGYFGPALCATCGRPEADPDHDGDVDSPGVPDSDAPQHADVPVDTDGNPTGCMVAFFPTQTLAQQLAIEGGEPVDELHVTLAFIGDAPTGDDLDRLRGAVAGFAAVQGPVDGVLSGVGLFTAGDRPVTYASVDCPALPAFRQDLVDALTVAGFPPNQTHGYTPHMTLAYDAHPDTHVPNAAVNFDVLWLVAGLQRFPFPLPGPNAQPEGAAVTQTHVAGYDAETQVIANNKKHANAAKKHPFRAGEFPKTDGTSRCLMCGGDQPADGMCNSDAPPLSSKPGATVIPIAAAATAQEAAQIAAGIDAGVDQALTLLRSCNNDDLLPYAQQARDLLQGIEPACDELLEFFNVPDPDDVADTQKALDYGEASIVVLGDDWAVVDGGGTVLGRYESFEAAQGPLDRARRHLPLPVDPEYLEGEEPGDIMGGDPADEAPKVNPALAEAARRTAEAVHYAGIYTANLPLTPTLLQTKAFVEEINGKTIITTQASTMSELAGAMTSHEHYLWTQGRLVGADQANRNGAYWSSGDLELGQTTVPYGPLNWLHEEKHVIGTIAAASYSQPGEKALDGFTQNHIAIAAPIWRWLYPDEAAVIEMASETGKFWYSMECISKNVACVGDGGCGAEVSYFDYMQGQNGACDHMVQKSGTRRFVDPIFLGAAVIVPPVRPGWAGADAVVAQQVASIAEKAFYAAGQPDMSASDWEMLMGEVVRFATA